jgi:hypothetical protein
MGIFPVHQRLLCVAIVAEIFTHACRAQDLAPRAYFITPLHSNAITLTWSLFDGSLDYNDVIPTENATGTYNLSSFSYYHSFGLFRRSANVVASLPYGIGNFQGTQAQAYRSGLTDSVARVSVNLWGGPAMPVEKFIKWKQKKLFGASLKVIAPTGQYDPTRLINWGTNRWSLKTELGYSQARGKWVFDAYAGVWFFTKNPEYLSHNVLFAGTQSQSEKPIGTLEGHISYDIKPRLWASLDGNYWRGGITSLNDVENTLSRQAGSRFGATVSIPTSKHQSVKMSYSNGIYVRYGGDYQSVSFAWQYSWLGRPP